MKRNYWILLLIMLGACNIKEQSEIQKEVLATEEVIHIDADSLLTSFAKDSNAASELYMGKVLSIKGEVLVFEQFKDTITFKSNDTLPEIVQWFMKRLESDINTTNIIFKPNKYSVKHSPPYSLNATFPKEYRNELKGIKEKSNVQVKGRLEHISTVYVNQADSTRKPVSYIISVQGCLLDNKK